MNPKFVMNTHEKFKRLWFIAAILFAFSYFLYINLLMPMAGEDYTLQPWQYNAKPATIIAQVNAVSNRVIDSIVLWSPRIGEALATITAAFPPIIFDILNTILLIWLVLILFIIGYGRLPDWQHFSDGFALFSILFLMITLVPLLGQLFFWKAGTCNHTWGLIMLLSFTLPFRINYSHKVRFKNNFLLVLYVVFGFFAGLTVENASTVVLGFLLIHYFVSMKQKRIDGKFIYPLVSLAAGTFFLLFSPSTTIRRNFYESLGYEGGLSGIDLYLNRLVKISNDFINLSWLLIAVFLACLILVYVMMKQKHALLPLYRNDGKERKLTIQEILVLILGSIIPVLVLISIPYQGDQQRGFELFWLLIISLSAYLLTEIWIRISLLPLRYGSVLLLGFILAIQLFNIGDTYTKLDREYNNRMAIIDTALRQGDLAITLPVITVENSRIVETRETLPDIGDRIARYYGFDQVLIEK